MSTASATFTSKWAKRLITPKTYYRLPVRLWAPWPRRFLASLMLLALQFRPESVHWFSDQRIFPNQKRRLEKTGNPLDDFGIDHERTTGIPPLEKVTVIQRGVSFDRSQIDQLPGPIYAVNWREKLKRNDVVYVTCDSGYLQRFQEMQMFPVLFIEVNWFDAQGNYVVRDKDTEVERCLDDSRITRFALYHKAGPHIGGMPSTSGLACLVYLAHYSEAVEVHGWDFYMTFHPAYTGYWNAFFGHFLNFYQEVRAKKHVENAIYNWHYAKRLAELPNFVNHGFLSGLENHPGINKRLDRVFYNV